MKKSEQVAIKIFRYEQDFLDRAIELGKNKRVDVIDVDRLVNERLKVWLYVEDTADLFNIGREFETQKTMAAEKEVADE